MPLPNNHKLDLNIFDYHVKNCITFYLLKMILYPFGLESARRKAEGKHLFMRRATEKVSCSRELLKYRKSIEVFQEHLIDNLIFAFLSSIPISVPLSGTFRFCFR